MSDKIVKLSNCFLEVGIAPDCGGSVVYFRTKGTKLFDIFRPASATAIQKRDALGMSMFLMLPYTHRISEGKFTYWGITRLVANNHSGFNCPIHGDGWQAKWIVEKQTDTSVTLSYTHSKEKGFPFNYEAQVVYTLSDKTLSVEMTLENKALLPMPCGLGVHPFFLKTPNVMLQFDSKNVWYHENDPIDRPYPTPKEWSFQSARELKDSVFDTCFGGFNETALIKWPKFGVQVQMTADDIFGHCVLFAPPKKNFFSVEPTTMATDAFNIASRGIIGTGIKSIGQGETLLGKISFDVTEF